MNVLELFAGSKSIGNEAEKQNHNVFSSDINNFDGIDYVINILNFDIKKVPFIPDAIWASPPCTAFSVASIGTHWYENNTPKTKDAVLGVEIVSKTLEIINYFLKLNPNLKWYMENPRGKLRKLPVVKGIPRITVWYCQYSSKEKKETRAKPTDIWSNNIYNPMFNPTGWKPRYECSNSNKKCHHEESPRGSKTGTQGLKNNYERSKLPQQLCEEIIKSI